MVKYSKRVENYVLMYLNAPRHMAALGAQGMFLPMPYGGIRAEWVKRGNNQSFPCKISFVCCVYRNTLHYDSVFVYLFQIDTQFCQLWAFWTSQREGSGHRRITCPVRAQDKVHKINFNRLYLCHFFTESCLTTC